MNDISVFLQVRLNRYQFLVYSTEFCPRNGTEWFQRSSDLNCTLRNGYMCMPNEELTTLLEFCYKKPNILIEKGKKQNKKRNLKDLVFHQINKNSIWVIKSYTCKITYWCFLNFIKCVLGFFIIFLIAFCFSWLIWL